MSRTYHFRKPYSVQELLSGRSDVSDEFYQDIINSQRRLKEQRIRAKRRRSFAYGPSAAIRNAFDLHKNK